MVSLSGSTSVYGIIGDPVSHSLSPMFQNHFIKQSAQNAIYIPLHVQAAQLNQALAGLHAANIQGLNITVPHKELTLTLSQADHDAIIIGAVNTLRRTASGWSATNTDWLGFAAVLQGLKANISQSPIILFGAGGTSRAVCHALHHQGAKEILLCNRSADRAKQLISDLHKTYPNMKVSLLPWQAQDVLTASKTSQVVINTTSIGLHQNDTFPFSLCGEGIAIDAVYKPSGETAFCHAANHGGYKAVDGLPMLIAQGIASFKFWHQETGSSTCFDLPDKLQSLLWMEQQLKRQPLNLEGWRT